jgi:eukaryotic-like serine/threonine-protein kinase
MDSATEGRLLRLAIAKGLLTWEDLDRVVEGLPEGEGRAERSWLRLVVDTGLLDETKVSALRAELLATESTVSGRSEGGRSDAGPAPFPPEHRFLAGWPRYRVERLLGSGGMGTVFLAFDPTLGRRVALKLLHRNDPEQTGRFLREARAQARVEHPNVCQVYEVGEVEGRPYIAMQHIEGKNLSDLRGQLSPEAIVRLVRDVALAIQAAHKTGLIHRDLKPANILVATGDKGDLLPFVVDFGLARDQEDTELSRTGMISGTPSYLSPEQAEGIPLDRRSDVYSLGVILYEMLSGQPPFQGTSPAHVLVRILQEDAVPLRKTAPSVPPDLETIVMKCLEKDPARRYDSARALADDLDSWLEGEPIAARRAGWAYRAGKRLRKHRLLAAVSAAACVALLLLGGTVLRTRWQARERAEMAQRFGQRVEELQSHMRYSAFLPRHDMRSAKRELRRELDEIRREMEQLGPLAEGPGNYALGQGYLALRQYETARRHLEKAWNAGEHRPEVAAALGRTLGFLYEKALADASRGRGADARKASREELSETYRRPALSYLKAGLRGEAGRSPYLEALVASYEGRYDHAVARAREAHRQTPWFYEAGQLEADIWVNRAEEAADAGETEQGNVFFTRAGEVYARLLAAVPSDISLHAGECSRQVRRLDLLRGGGKELDQDEDQALRACDRALEVDPELGEVLGYKAWVWWMRGYRQSRRGIDPTPALATSIQLSRKALDLDRSDAGGWKSLAVAHRLQGQWELGRGVDPVASLRKSIEAAAQAVRLQPEIATNHNELGIAYLVLANDRLRRGVDPRDTLREAAASYRRALEINPRLLAAHVNQGNTWNLMAEAEIARGQDPSGAVSQATAAFEAAARLNPDPAPIHNNLGNTWLTFGEYQIARGMDPGPSLDRAAANYRKALATRPDYPYGAYNLALTEKNRALARLGLGQDPAPALAAARAHVAESLRINPTDADNFLEQARLDLISARWALRQGSVPGPELDRADAALAKAEALNPGSPEIFQSQAESARYRAEAALARGGRPQEAIRQGLDRLAEALSIRPEDARTLALHGALWQLAARAESDPARRAEAAARAAASLDKALRLNPLLQREFGPVLAAVR